MTNRKMLQRLAFVLLLSPGLLNSGNLINMAKKYNGSLEYILEMAKKYNGSLEYIIEKGINCFTYVAINAIQVQSEYTLSNNTSIISIGANLSLLARITVRKFFKKNISFKSLAKDVLSITFNTGISHKLRKHNAQKTYHMNEKNVCDDSCKIAELTTLFEFGMDLIDYYFFK